MLTQSFRGEFQIRRGDWKHLDHKGSGGNDYSGGILQKYALLKKAPDAVGQLYNLRDDPGETTNLFVLLTAGSPMSQGDQREPVDRRPKRRPEGHWLRRLE